MKELVQFRLLHMPCCGILLCWVNPRRPMRCPECGEMVFHHFPKAEWETWYSAAWLDVENYDMADFFQHVKQMRGNNANEKG